MKQIISYSDFEKITFQNFNLKDEDYKFYNLFLKKFYSKVFVNTIINSIIEEINSQGKNIFDNKLKIEYKFKDDNFEFIMELKNENNKNLLQEELDKLLITEQIIYKSLFEKINNIKFIDHYEQYIRLLQTVFCDLKNELSKEIEKIDANTLNELMYKILVSIFNKQSIDIERAIVNENKNVK